MRRLFVLAVAGSATIGSAFPAFADQAQTDLESGQQLLQQLQTQQMQQQQQQQQLVQQQGWNYSLGAAGVEPYCTQYGTCPASGQGMAGYGQRPGLDTLFPRLFGQTPQADPAAYPTAEGSPETADRPLIGATATSGAGPRTTYRGISSIDDDVPTDVAGPGVSLP